jgi:polysaccharide biosynthesis transport protein
LNNSLTKVVESSAIRASAPSEATVGDWFKVLRRRRRTIIVVLLACLALVTLKAVLTTPRYMAKGEIQIQKDRSSLGPLNALGDSSSAAGGTSDTLDYNVTLQTQVNILESDSIALQVIKQLNLETTEDFFPQHKHGFHLIPSWVFFWRKPIEPLSVPLENAPNRRYVALKIFSSNLKIVPISGTRLIDVSYANPDPRLAADVVNHMVAAFTDYNFEMRQSATSQTSKWLVGQLSDLKKTTEELQAKANALQRETGMFGNDDEHNMVLARLKNLNDSLSAAESNRIMKEATYRAVLSGGAEGISGLSGDTSSGGSAQNSLALLQTLRGQQAQIGAQLAQDRIKYGPTFPKLVQEQAQYSDFDKAIHAELQRIGTRATSDYRIAASTESDARKAFEQQKIIANDLNDKATSYALAKEEADKSRELYEGLLGKLKESDVLEGLRSSNTTVVNPGRVPPPNQPKSPNLPLYYAAGIVCGLFLGVVAAVIVDLTDHAYRSLDEVESSLGASILGVMPAFGRKRVGILGRGESSSWRERRRLDSPVTSTDIYVVEHPGSSYAESVRSLRTLLSLSRNGAPPKVVLVTSSVAGEGKTTLSLNLAAMFGQQGSKVLLVNGDLRRRGLDTYLDISDSRGLSAALTGSSVDPQCHILENVANVSVVVGGTSPPFPAELLGSDKMRQLVSKWRLEYDYIVIDSPPVLPVTDAILLSQVSDASLLVVRHGSTARHAVQRSYRSLRQQLPDKAILGVTLNAVPKGSVDYGVYDGYQGHSYTSNGAMLNGTM